MLEYATGGQALALHQLVCEGGSLADCPPFRAATMFLGKAILFARSPLTFPGEGPWTRVLNHAGPLDELPSFADLPHPGQRIDAGSPILTCFASASSVKQCCEVLQEIAGDLDHWLLGR
jgi:predicted ATP-grasp superfamily ATP-dependent carboligase